MAQLRLNLETKRERQSEFFGHEKVIKADIY